MTLVQMEQHALESRPELRIEDYNDRISQWQAREALFDMLPGMNLSTGANYDSDSFNLTPNWTNTGFQLGMNLFGLFSGTSKIDTAEKSGKLARRQRLAMTLAVMTQTHMAYIQFRGASQQMRLSREVTHADRRLSQLVASDKDFVNTNYFEAVRLKTRRLLAEIDKHQAQVDLVTAHSDVMHAIGLDVFPTTIVTNDLDALTGEIRKITAKWQTKGADIETPANTPLDLLVNAMLRNGEGPSKGQSKTKVFEVKLAPKQDTPTQAAKKLNDILPTAGPPEKKSVSTQLAAIKPKKAKPALKSGAVHVV
jgi:multidrug efflux system outer membrane protein